MANDRIYIRCKECGDTKMLIKCYPGNNSYVYDPEVLGEWFQKHEECIKFLEVTKVNVPFIFCNEDQLLELRKKNEKS